MFVKRGLYLYTIAIPPFICNVCPVIYSASSLAKNTTPLAISVGLPSFPHGIELRNLSLCSYFNPSVIGVAINPGAIQLIVTPRLATSCAKLLDIATIPALAAV